MTRATAERVIALLANSPDVETRDFTGGAPELNPNLRDLLEQARRLSRRVIACCNLAIIFFLGMEDLPRFYRDQAVELVYSLPCCTAENTDHQRGHGVLDRSIRALNDLNQLGSGRPNSSLLLTLIYNPLGAFVPPPQQTLESRYREEMARLFGVEFHHLLTITNMPIKRLANQLHRWGKYGDYMKLLVNHFNPQTVANLMCHHLVSVGWDGTLYDCDFNQMLELPIPDPQASGRPDRVATPEHGRIDGAGDHRWPSLLRLDLRRHLGVTPRCSKQAPPCRETPVRPPSRQQRLLVPQQPDLHTQAASVADQRTVGADDAVARNDNRNRVGGDRRTHRPAALRVAEFRGNSAV